MKRILYITNIPAPYTVEFFNDLGKNFDLTVVFEGKNSAERDQSWEKFNAINFKYSIIEEKQNINPFVSTSGIKKMLNEGKYDLCIVGNYSSFIGMKTIEWLRRKKLPYAIHADGGIVGEDSFLRYHVKRHFIRKAGLYFSSGHITTNYFTHYGAKKELVFEYPFSSVRADQIRQDTDNAKYREKLGLPANQKIIVSVGRIIPLKGVDVLIKSMSMVKTEAKLYIIGGAATPNLAALVDTLKLNNVEFIEFLPFNTVLDYMAAADLFVFLTRGDVWGLVINEAFSMGTPIISTDKCVAAVEMIENGKNGYIVESENPEAAAERIDFLLRHEDLCQRIKRNNIQKAAEYTIESMSETYSRIINAFFEQRKYRGKE